MRAVDYTIFHPLFGVMSAGIWRDEALGIVPGARVKRRIADADYNGETIILHSPTDRSI